MKWHQLFERSSIYYIILCPRLKKSVFLFFYAKRQSVRELDTCVGVDNVVTPFKRCKVKAVCAKQTIFEFIERRPRGRFGSRSRDRARR